MSGSPGPREYQQYLRSAHWRHVRQTTLEDAGHKCQICGARVGHLDVHRTTYERLGEEQASDLVVLCRVHHELLRESGSVVEELPPDWPWPGRDRPPSQRLCRAGLHWWETVTLVYPVAGAGPSPTVTRCRRCFTRRGGASVVVAHGNDGPRDESAAPAADPLRL
jgi:hypothetical protein